MTISSVDMSRPIILRYFTVSTCFVVITEVKVLMRLNECYNYLNFGFLLKEHDSYRKHCATHHKNRLI